MSHSTVSHCDAQHNRQKLDYRGEIHSRQHASELIDALLKQKESVDA